MPDINLIDPEDLPASGGMTAGAGVLVADGNAVEVADAANWELVAVAVRVI